MAWRSCYRDVLPFAAMVAVQCSGVGVNTLFKAAALRGMSYYAFIVYNNAISTLVLVPLSIIYSSTAVLPSTQFPLLKICLLALVGYRVQFSTSFFGHEQSHTSIYLHPCHHFQDGKPSLKSFSTQAKIIGTVLSISGALVVVLYQGSAILSFAAPTPSISIQKPLDHRNQSGSLVASYLPLILVSSPFGTSNEDIPCRVDCILLHQLECSHYICTNMSYSRSKLSAWRLEPGVSVVAVIFSGLFCSPLNSIHSRMESKIKRASLCSNIQSRINCHYSYFVMSIGFYAVTMGKAKEEETNER
ncbi:hypothetical protein GH714_010928 [Hevea brasiliensis]|uniref:WAT1-related protein n=1 Tax=Hevea brasiliensis TaxID=3981 RepID=A0A6A6M4M4_HEVBR|nr:hypothetical protein GH714_010928 [Hevea brasiliensis]